MLKPNRTPKDPVMALSGRQDSNLRPSGPKPDALPPAPLPELNATFLSGKTGTRTQGTLPRPQLSRLLHYHSATFPIGSANLDRKSICAIVFKQIINWLLSINLWVRYSNVIHSSYKALKGIAYRIDFLHGNRSIIKLTSC